MSSNVMVKCRLCLVETEEDKMYELFKCNEFEVFKTEADQKDEFSNLTLYEKVEYCCGVRVREFRASCSKIEISNHILFFYLHNKHKMPHILTLKCLSAIRNILKIKTRAVLSGTYFSYG